MRARDATLQGNFILDQVYSLALLFASVRWLISDRVFGRRPASVKRCITKRASQETGPAIKPGDLHSRVRMTYAPPLTAFVMIASLLYQQSKAFSSGRWPIFPSGF